MTNMTATALQQTERKIGEVEQETDRLAIQEETLAKQLAELEQRLGPVLALRAEEAGSNANAPEPVRVQLAETLHNRVVGLSRLSDFLQSIINRIEL